MLAINIPPSKNNIEGIKTLEGSIKEISLAVEYIYKKLSKIRALKVDKYDENIFLKTLYKIGYSRVLNKNKNKNIKLLTTAFQRRFRQSLINGIIDQECLLISKNIAKKIK